MSIASLSEVLQHAHSGDPWHGPSLEALLSDVTAEEAAKHPVAGGHSILELVLHMAAWVDEVAARLEGRISREPAEGDWPAAGGVSFTEARDRLTKAHIRLLEVLRRFPESRLGERYGGPREAATGSGVTFERMLVGVAEHAGYHGGQVALLKRALRG